MVIVSHNRAFTTALCRDLWSIKNGTLSAEQSSADIDFAAMYGAYMASAMGGRALAPDLSKQARQAAELDRQARKKGSRVQAAPGARSTILV